MVGVVVFVWYMIFVFFRLIVSLKVLYVLENWLRRSWSFLVLWVMRVILLVKRRLWMVILCILVLVLRCVGLKSLLLEWDCIRMFFLKDLKVWFRRIGKKMLKKVGVSIYFCFMLLFILNVLDLFLLYCIVFWDLLWNDLMKFRSLGG